MAPITRSQSRKATCHQGPSGIRKSSARAKRPRKTHPKVLGQLDSSPSAQTSSLLSLPPEIRNKIWKFALASPSGALHYSSEYQRYYTSNPSQRSDDTSIQYAPSLLRTCHQVALETLHLPLRINTIITPDLNSFFAFQSKVAQQEAAQGLKLHIPKVMIVPDQ